MTAAGDWAAIEADWLARPGIGTKKMLQAAGLTGRTDKMSDLVAEAHGFVNP